MSEIIIFIKENYVSIAVVVSIIFALLIIISIREWDLNPPKPESKLVQEVTVEAFNNESEEMKEIENLKLGSTDSFCQSHLGNSAKLETSCGELTQENCAQTKCCVWGEMSNNTGKCMAGDKNGPTFTNNLKTMTAYYWQGFKRNI